MKQANNYDGARQQPLGSPFSARSTTADLIKGIDLTGTNAIVTGGYAGIGLETTKTLAAAGARVWVPARDVRKAAEALAGLPGVTVQPMDLMDPASIDRFAAGFLATEQPLHLLINNAGIMWVPLRRDDRGYESQLATNHLGHFQLTARLWPALKKAGATGAFSAADGAGETSGARKTGGARVVTVSSFGHQIAPFDFKDPNFEHRTYETLSGYGQSKTANILFSLELDRRGRALGVRAYSLHPGSVIGTDLGREAPMALFQQMGTHDADGKLFPEVAARLKTPQQGAATTLWCATSPMLAEISGVYCEDCEVAVIDNGTIEHRYDDPATLHGVRPYAVDAKNAQELWALSEKMLNCNFAAD